MNKVLIVATSMKTRGGITAVIKTYKRGMQWRKYKCHWIQTHRDGPAFRKILYLITALCDYVIRLPFAKIVHVHISLQTTAKRKMPFVKLAKLLKKSVIIHLHCGSQIDEIWNKNYDYLFRSADVALLLSESLKDKVNSHIHDRTDLRVCYNPCPTITSNTRYAKVKTILFSGTLCQKKGYIDLIKAFALVSRDFPEWTLTIAGNGDIKSGEALATALQISSKVRFLGWVNGEDKHRAFSEASIFCLPSYAEGFPMAVLDAWAYGLPVITTPVGGIPDVAVEGKNMLLFNPGDVDKLAEQLARLMENEDLRESISKQSRQLAATTFNQDTINQQLNDLYESLLDK